MPMPAPLVHPLRSGKPLVLNASSPRTADRDLPAGCAQGNGFVGV